jgi:hypothetical protein
MFGLNFESKSLNLNLRSFVKFCATRTSSVGSPAFSASTDALGVFVKPLCSSSPCLSLELCFGPIDF